jgi:hypothetical protein
MPDVDENVIFGLFKRLTDLETEQDLHLSGPMAAIASQVAQVATQNQRLVTQLQGSILKVLDKGEVSAANLADEAATTVLNALGGYQENLDWTMQQLLTEAGFGPDGLPLEEALLQGITQAPELVIASESVRMLDAIGRGLYAAVEVLKEIRDRLPSLAVRLPGELPGADVGDDIRLDGWSPPASDQG